MATTNRNQEFDYQLLRRLQQDCDYYLGAGQRTKKYLWALDEAEQIQKMKDVYASLVEKPEWLTLDDIEKYERAMLTPYVAFWENKGGSGANYFGTAEERDIFMAEARRQGTEVWSGEVWRDTQKGIVVSGEKAVSTWADPLEEALREVTVNSMQVPKAFQWTSNGHRGGRTQAELEEAWPRLSLEERVGLTACLMGYPVQSPPVSKLVSDAYLALCHGQPLMAFCANLNQVEAQPSNGFYLSAEGAGVPMGKLAKACGCNLPLQVLESARGFYLGTADEEGPCSRESEEYWPTAEAATKALAGKEGEDWTQRQSL